jgi:Uma2 family endonuclease
MSVHTRHYLTADEYLTLERSSEGRSEYFAGEMVAMTGGSWEHSLIIGNVFAELKRQLRRGPCRVHASELRVRVPDGLYTYPDLVVVCGEPRFADDCRDTVLNPTLIAEVLSPSTESYDRGRKFEHYRSLDSLHEYVLVAQNRPRVEKFMRQDDGIWLFVDAAGLDDVIPLVSVDCELSLAAAYDGIDFST